MTLAFGGCVAGVITGRFAHLHIFQISFFFLLLKLLTEIHVLSYVRRLSEKRVESEEVSQVTNSELQRHTTSV